MQNQHVVFSLFWFVHLSLSTFHIWSTNNGSADRQVSNTAPSLSTVSRRAIERTPWKKVKFVLVEYHLTSTQRKRLSFSIGRITFFIYVSTQWSRPSFWFSATQVNLHKKTKSFSSIEFELSAILRRLNAPRTVISNQNEYLRSKLTTTLTAVSSIFLILYTPYAIVQTVSYFVVRSYMSKCDIIFVLRLKIFKRLSELLNIIALGINFFFYILAINHYRSSAIKMLRLDQIRIFTKVKQTPTTSQSNKLRTIDQTHEPELYQIHRTTNGHLKTTINGCSSSITPSSTYV